jgi:outer membrane protein insertion porin family
LQPRLPGISAFHRAAPARAAWCGLLLLLGLLLLAPAALAQGPIVEEILVHGNRRIPRDTIQARIFTRPGDVFDENALQRDFHSLWNAGYFEDIRFEREESPRGYRIHIYVKEKPTIRRITYNGLNSVPQSDVLERFKERKVGLSQESPYDPTKVKKAEVAVKELLSENGRQFATIHTEVRQIPPSAVEVILNIKEGPKVKVGKIRFEGNKVLSDRRLRRAMKGLRPIGIPHSIFLENIFSKTFDARKLAYDQELVRDAYQQKGYFKALVQDPQTNIRDTGGLHIPLFRGKGKRVDITFPIEEGERYRLESITFINNKVFQNSAALRLLFATEDGDWFNVEHFRKGLENLRKAYGEHGYINFTPVPDLDIDDEKRIIRVKIDMDEGKQYFVRRIEFQGNTTTRDKVIRRELALEEGNAYNASLWEFSVLRLNQLGYFEQINHEQDTVIQQNNQQGTIDLTLKVKEKGKNTIGLTGGVSGLAGSFIGISYETNNFLGLGETLRVEANVGSRERNLLFGFTEPYLFDRPLQFGFTVFTRKFNFNQAQQLALFTGTEVDLPPETLAQLQNYTQNSTGFSVSTSYQLRRSLKRIGLTYAFDTSSVSVFSDASRRLFEFLAFRSGVSGPNALQGIVTSKVLPSFIYNSLDSASRPTRGKSLFIGGEISGLGGNVRSIRPIVEFKHFTPVRRFGHVFGYRVQGGFLTGYGGQVAPPLERFYMGGDTDVRGFDVRFISPYAFIVNKVDLPLQNPDGTLVPKDPANPRRGNITIPLAVHNISFVGGDTSLIANAEYRIPIAGPVTMAFFSDFGLNGIARRSQLRISDVVFNELNTTPLGCPALNAAFECVGGVSASFERNLPIIGSSNWVPRMSTGIEFQVILPIVNAPFRIYYAYNPLRLDASTTNPTLITRDMFPPGGAGDFTFQNALSAFTQNLNFREPRKTFRFAVSTTF